MPRFRPEEMFRTLEAHGVRYLLIGGLAATLHGSPLRTGDADICPAKDAANLERLARALEAMDARIRAPDAEAGVRFACDARFLAGVELLNLTTRFGDLDIAFRPAGTGGYDDLLQGAERYDLEGLVVPVASLPDVIRSKKAANRPKDHAALDTLQELLRRSVVSVGSIAIGWRAPRGMGASVAQQVVSAPDG